MNQNTILFQNKLFVFFVIKKQYDTQWKSALKHQPLKRLRFEHVEKFLRAKSVFACTAVHVKSTRGCCFIKVVKFSQRHPVFSSFPVVYFYDTVSRFM